STRLNGQRFREDDHGWRTTGKRSARRLRQGGPGGERQGDDTKEKHGSHWRTSLSLRTQRVHCSQKSRRRKGIETEISSEREALAWRRAASWGLAASGLQAQRPQSTPPLPEGNRKGEPARLLRNGKRSP